MKDIKNLGYIFIFLICLICLSLSCNLMSAKVFAELIEPSISFSQNGGTITMADTVTITATDTNVISTLYYKWDEGTYNSVAASSVVISPPSSGSHILYAYVEDTEGSIGSTASATYTVNIIPTITSAIVSGPISYGQDISVDVKGSNIAQSAYRIYYTTSLNAPDVDTTLNAASPGTGWIDSGVAGLLTVKDSETVSDIVSGNNIKDMAWTYVTIKFAVGSETNNWAWKYSQGSILNMNVVNNPNSYIGYVGHNQIININGEKIVLSTPDTPNYDYGPYNNVSLIESANTFFDQDYVTYRLEFDVVNPSKIEDMKINLYAVGGIDLNINSMKLQKRQEDGTFAVIKDLNSSYTRQGLGRYSVRLGNDIYGNSIITANGAGRYAIEYTGKIKVATFLKVLRTFTQSENIAIISVYATGNNYPATLQMKNQNRKFYVDTKVSRKE